MRFPGNPIRVWAWGATLLAVACVDTDPTPGDGAAAGVAAPTTDAVEEAVWSADGRRLAATWTRGEDTRLVGLFGPADGVPPGEGTGLPLADGEAGWATWSPEGLWVAYAAGSAGGREVVRARPDGTGAENLTRHAADDFDPAYSPDGRTLAFVSTRDGGTPKLHVMDADGGDVRLLAELGGPVRHPAWAPDGGRLAVQVSEGGGEVIYVVTADGSGSGRVGTGTLPAWFPDGRITFTENDSVFSRPGQGGLRRIVVPDARAGRPSPDGRWVAFVRGKAAAAVLYLLDVETGDTTAITPR